MPILVAPGVPPFALPERAIELGRADECDVIVDHPSVSRRHAGIRFDGGRHLVRDLGSTNGTFVGDEPVAGERALGPGDVLRIGDVAFDVLDDAEARPIVEIEVALADRGLDALLAEGEGDGALRLRPGGDADRRAAEKLRILLEVARLLASPEPAGDRLERIVDLAVRILDVGRAVLLLVDGATGRLAPRVTRAPAGATGSLYSQHIVEYVRASGRAALFVDARADPRLREAASVVAQSIRAALCVPLKTRAGVRGVLYVDHQSEVNRFSPEDLEFLVAFAAQAALALENDDLHRQVEREAVLRGAMARFFPPATVGQLIERPDAFAGLAPVEAEVTSLFADVAGFTARAAAMPPREVVALLNAYFPILADVVFRHEGTIEKYIGDALVALWGAPLAHPDDADRAVRAAADMQRGVRAENARRAAAGLPTIDIHVGLNTGVAAVGNIGSAAYLQYAAIGDATNTTARVCAVAAAGEILLTDATLARLSDGTLAALAEPLPPVRVKGKEAPLSLRRLRWDRLP